MNAKSLISHLKEVQTRYASEGWIIKSKHPSPVAITITGVCLYGEEQLAGGLHRKLTLPLSPSQGNQFLIPRNKGLSLYQAIRVFLSPVETTSLNSQEMPFSSLLDGGYLSMIFSGLLEKIIDEYDSPENTYYLETPGPFPLPSTTAFRKVELVWPFVDPFDTTGWVLEYRKEDEVDHVYPSRYLLDPEALSRVHIMFSK